MRYVMQMYSCDSEPFLFTKLLLLQHACHQSEMVRTEKAYSKMKSTSCTTEISIRPDLNSDLTDNGVNVVPTGVVTYTGTCQ